MLRKRLGTGPAPGFAGYQPKPNPSPLTVSAPSGEFSDCAISECWVFKINSDGWSGSPEYASQRHIVRASSPSGGELHGSRKPYGGACTASIWLPFAATGCSQIG